MASPTPAEEPRAGGVAFACYSVTLLLSAALLFLVQPMFARLVLPLLGGTPAVWNASVAFFQLALLAGYLYAHWTIRRLGPRRQALLHLAVLLVPLLVLPIGVPAGWAPPGHGEPILWLLSVLALFVGLPFFVVASTAPLLQRWLAGMDHPRAADPYVLYRASNAGSLVGLLGYPALMEPTLRLGEQRTLWALGYGALLVLVAACAVLLWRSGPPTAADGTPDAGPALAGPTAARPWLRRRLSWAGLAFVPSSLMLGVTTFLTTDLSPVPLLWVIPLGLYLVSFIVVFSPGRGSAVVYELSSWAFPVLGLALVVVLALGIRSPFWLVAALHLAAFFAAALVCHGRLAADRPHPRHLTGFYLWVALGGALGGAFNTLVAPVVFEALTEYPLALVLACLCLPARDRRGSAMAWRLDLGMPLLLGLGLLAAVLVLGGDLGSITGPRLLVYALAALACLTLVRRPLRFGLSAGAVLAATSVVALVASDSVVFQERSFFGTLEVESRDGGRYRTLRSGTTLHGAQLVVPGRTPEPISYYHRTSPVGEVVEALRPGGRTRRAAVVGLGTGSMACHSRPGERWTFLEIDPAVERIARDPRLFTYLRDCPGTFEVVLGDARLSLARDPERRYGLIVLDAFSSDAIPVHLLTREAVELYRSRLEPGGALAFHVSNRYLDLQPVLGDVAGATGMACVARFDPPSDRAGQPVPGKSTSHWVAMARHRAELGPIADDRRWRPCRTGAASRAWSDDYANVLGALISSGGAARP